MVFEVELHQIPKSVLFLEDGLLPICILCASNNECDENDPGLRDVSTTPSFSDFSSPIEILDRRVDRDEQQESFYFLAELLVRYDEIAVEVVVFSWRHPLP